MMRMEEDEPFNIGRGLTGRGLRRREARQNEGETVRATFYGTRPSTRFSPRGTGSAREVSSPLIRSKDEELNTGSGAGAGALTPPPSPLPTRVASDTGTNISEPSITGSVESQVPYD